MATFVQDLLEECEEEMGRETYIEFCRDAAMCLNSNLRISTEPCGHGCKSKSECHINRKMLN